MVFPIRWMHKLDHKESWTLKNWCFWTVVLEKTLESLLDCKEIKPVNPKGNQSWIFIGRTDAEAEVPVFQPPDAKSRLIRKDHDAVKDWRQEEKGMTENKMVVWHHQLSGHEFEQTLGVGEGQGSVACCSLWGPKESDTTEWLNNNNLICTSKVKNRYGEKYSYIHRYSCISEKAMAPLSSTLAWKIPWTEEPGRLQSMGSLRVRRNWVTSLSLFIIMHWKRKWQSTPVFLPGESQGQGSLVGYRLWSHTELDTTEVT